MFVTVRIGDESIMFDVAHALTVYSAKTNDGEELSLYLTDEGRLRVRSYLYLPIEVDVSSGGDLTVLMIRDVNYPSEVKPKSKIKRRKISWKNKKTI